MNGDFHRLDPVLLTKLAFRPRPRLKPIARLWSEVNGFSAAERRYDGFCDGIYMNYNQAQAVGCEDSKSVEEDKTMDKTEAANPDVTIVMDCTQASGCL